MGSEGESLQPLLDDGHADDFSRTRETRNDSTTATAPKRKLSISTSGLKVRRAVLGSVLFVYLRFHFSAKRIVQMAPLRQHGSSFDGACAVT